MNHRSICLDVVRTLQLVLGLVISIWASGCFSEISVAAGRQARSTQPPPGAPSAAPSSVAASSPPADRGATMGKGAEPLSGSSDAPVTAAPSGRACDELANAAEALLTRYCAGCHAGGNAQGGFGDALDVPAMIARSFHSRS